MLVRRGTEAGLDMVIAILFLASVIAAIFLVFRSPIAIHWRVTVALAIAAFALLAYALAARSGVSPFSSRAAISFGYSDQWLPTVLAVVGAVAGVVGSYFFHLG